MKRINLLLNKGKVIIPNDVSNELLIIDQVKVKEEGIYLQVQPLIFNEVICE